MVAGSRLLRDGLRAWAIENEHLDFTDGDQLVASTQRRDADCCAERDRVLDALLHRATDDAQSRPIALQVVLPWLKSLIRGIRGWDVNERTARVVATAVDVLAW